jgi:AcrR family transcriptional regulator
MAKAKYHHGDLEAALIDAAVDVVLAHGVGAVALRDLARTIGVSPSATYRHFPSRDHLVAVISQRARQQLAMAMIDARSTVPATGSHASRSVRRFRAIGRAYVEFAVRQPNLFNVAFTPCPVQPSTPEDPNAWAVLVGAIDEMVDTGAMPTTRRTDAPLVAWSGVHGLSTILTAATRPSEPGLHHTGTDAMIDTVVDAVVRSLGA